MSIAVRRSWLGNECLCSLTTSLSEPTTRCSCIVRVSRSSGQRRHRATKKLRRISTHSSSRSKTGRRVSRQIASKSKRDLRTSGPPSWPTSLRGIKHHKPRQTLTLKVLLRWSKTYGLAKKALGASCIFTLLTTLTTSR